MTVRQDKLANGFRIVTEDMPGLQSAAIGIWVTAGARHERAEQNGIAHFLEHMAFKGTEKFTAEDVNRIFPACFRQNSEPLERVCGS